jgi:hypothetical protein
MEDPDFTDEKRMPVVETAPREFPTADIPDPPITDMPVATWLIWLPSTLSPDVADPETETPAAAFLMMFAETREPPEALTSLIPEYPGASIVFDWTEVPTAESTKTPEAPLVVIVLPLTRFPEAEAPDTRIPFQPLAEMVFPSTWVVPPMELPEDWLM